MKKRFKIISVITVFILTLFLFNFKPVAAAKLPKGSTIGNISVEKLDDQTVKQKLQEAIDIWLLGDDLVLKSDYEKYIIPREAITFDVDTTVNKLKEKTKRHYSNFFLGKKNVTIPIEAHVIEDHIEVKKVTEKSYINKEKTLSNVIDVANKLNEASVTIVYDDTDAIELHTIAEQTFDIEEGMSNAVLTYAINELDGHIIAPNDIFSFLTAVELPEKMPRSNEELSFLASALYTLFLQTNFDIILRETDIYKPSFIDQGLDVLINREEKIDFITQNPNEFSFKIDVKKVKDTIEISLKSYPLQEIYEYEFKHVKKVNPHTVYRYSKVLAPGESDLISNGTEGFNAKVYRNTYNKSGVLTESELVSHEFSLPKPRIVLVSTEDVVENDETLYETDDIVNEDYFNLIDYEHEMEKLAIEIEDTVIQYLDELNEQMEKQSEQFIEQYLDFAKTIETGDEQELERLVDELKQKITSSENKREKLQYQFLLDILTSSMKEDVKEG